MGCSFSKGATSAMTSSCPKAATTGSRTAPQNDLRQERVETYADTESEQGIENGLLCKECTDIPKSTETTTTDATFSETASASAKVQLNTVIRQSEKWNSNRGYSSGASSFQSSGTSSHSSSSSPTNHSSSHREEKIDNDRFDVAGNGTTIVNTQNLKQSQSYTNFLSSLKEDFAAHSSGLTTKVVRLETPCDTPVETVYDGVHDGLILGEGVSGVVRLITHRATGVQYAMKCLPFNLMTTGQAGLEQLRNEIFIMCQLDLPYIVRIEEVYESLEEMYIVQELCNGGELFDRLEEQDDYHYTEVQCAKLVKQMLAAVRYLHSKGIVHRDLKLENFLFASSQPDSELKMIDFGLSKHFETGQYHCEQVGTPYCVAPEIIKGNYDEKCDIWALGVITYLLLCGQTPFGGLDGESLLSVKEKIMRAELVYEPKEAWESVSDAGKAFVSQLLISNPRDRPSAKDMQRSEWIQVWSKKDSREEKQLNPKTVSALMEFKKCSDMKKLLSEVLSFTLMPDQIMDLRSEFEKMDLDGDGEISLNALKEVLMQNAEAGALGGLTDREVEDLFDTLRVNKSETTIRWHEFLAASLSQAKVDDRNLHLAFDRLDAQRKGYLTFEDISQVLGDDGSLQMVWLSSLEECDASCDRIAFLDFVKIIKGQPMISPVSPPTSAINLVASSGLSPLPSNRLTTGAVMLSAAMCEASASDIELCTNQKEESSLYHKVGKSQSYGGKERFWLGEESTQVFGRSVDSVPEIPIRNSGDIKASSLFLKSSLYRRHFEMRHGVLEASKRFDLKMRDLQSRRSMFTPSASLVMKRGAIANTKPGSSREIQESECTEVEAILKRKGTLYNCQHRKTTSDIVG